MEKEILIEDVSEENVLESTRASEVNLDVTVKEGSFKVVNNKKKEKKKKQRKKKEEDIKKMEEEARKKEIEAEQKKTD